MLTALAISLLASCGRPSRPPVDDALRARALASLQGGLASPPTIVGREVWQGREDIVCGLIAPPASLLKLRSALRFYYRDAIRQGQVEYHELVAAQGRVPPARIIENRRAFERLWQRACAQTES